jgi:hypothetical protein
MDTQNKFISTCIVIVHVNRVIIYRCSHSSYCITKCGRLLDFCNKTVLNSSWNKAVVKIIAAVHSSFRQEYNFTANRTHVKTLDHPTIESPLQSLLNSSIQFTVSHCFFPNTLIHCAKLIWMCYWVHQKKNRFVANAALSNDHISWKSVTLRSNTQCITVETGQKSIRRLQNAWITTRRDVTETDC